MRSHLSFLFLCAAFIAVAGPALGVLQDGQDPGKSKKKPTLQDRSQYVGAKVCRNCHRSKAKGEQYVHWESKTTHPNAYKTLATAKAKEIAEAKGLGDPQKAAECLKCHITGHGENPKRMAKTYKLEYGVQCESCHGPGSQHVKLRSRALAKSKNRAEAAKTLGTTEVGEISLPTEKDCRSCHNEESPTYKPYEHKSFLAKVAHPNPMRPRNQNKAADEATQPDGGSE